MKIDFSQKLLDMKGNPLGNTEDSIISWLRKNKPEVYEEMIKDLGTKCLTLRDVCATSLLAERILGPGERPPTTDEKIRRLRLAMKIDCSRDSIVDLDARDITYIQDLLNIYPVITCGQAKLLLDGKSLDDLRKEYDGSNTTADTDNTVAIRALLRETKNGKKDNMEVR